MTRGRSGVYRVVQRSVNRELAGFIAGRTPGGAPVRGRSDLTRIPASSTLRVMASHTVITARARTRPISIGFVNLGCSKNQVDSEVMLGALARDGFTLTDDPACAEVVIINTCGFIEEAKQESINAIIEHGALKKTGSCQVLIAAGCLAQRYQGELLKALPELDGVVGTGDTGRVSEICRSLLAPGGKAQRVWASPPPYLYDELTPRLRLGKAHSAYVKIAEGCNRHCAFCAIPLMRGKQRSRPIESIVAEAAALAADGVKEINLISQDTINYGVDLGLRHGLVTLLRKLVTVKGLRWIRPFYLYPQQVTEDLIDLYSDEEGTPAADLDKKIDRAVMEERRAELLAVQEQIALKKSRRLIGNTIEVMVEGISEETELLLEARHQGQAHEIDGVVYLNDCATNLTRPPQARQDAPLPVPGDFVKVEITDAAAYDLVGRIVG